MIILGLDCGLTKKNPTGVALIETFGAGQRIALLRCTALSLLREREDWEWDRRVAMLALQINGLCRAWYPDLIAWEVAPLMKGNAQTLIKLSHIGGIALGVAATLGVHHQIVSPSEAKRALTGKGNASKEQMIEAAWAGFGAKLSKDMADALGVALAADALFRTPRPGAGTPTAKAKKKAA